MIISEYKKDLKKPLLPRTLTFLIKGDKVLLGYKKTRFGKGYVLGIGGKVEDNEKIEHAAKREVFEEIGVEIISIKYVGRIDFYFPHVKNQSWDQTIHIFTASQWQGEPQESEEIKPNWYGIEAIPYKDMWDDAKYWLPTIVRNGFVEGEFLFNEKLRVSDYTLNQS